MSIKVKINNDWVDTNIQAVRGVNHVNSEDVYTKEESDALFSGKVSKSDIVQSTGISETSVMSQKAVTDALSKKADLTNSKQTIRADVTWTNDIYLGDETHELSFNNNGDLIYNGDKVMVGSTVSNEVSLVQNTGQSTTSVMSQKAVSDTINKLKNAGYLYAGIATPTTNPGTPDGPVFYIANSKGTYTNFGGIDVTEDEVVILYYDTVWHKEATGMASNDKLTELNEELYESTTITTFLRKTDLDFQKGYVNTDGTVIEHALFITSKFVDVVGIDKVQYKDLRSPASFYNIIACYNASKVFIDNISLKGSSTAELHTGEFIIPNSVAFIRLVSVGENAEPSLSYNTIQKNSIIEQLKKSVNTLNESSNVIGNSISQANMWGDFENGYLTKEGSTGVYNQSKLSPFIPVIEGSEIYYNLDVVGKDWCAVVEYAEDKITVTGYINNPNGKSGEWGNVIGHKTLSVNTKYIRFAGRIPGTASSLFRQYVQYTVQKLGADKTPWIGKKWVCFGTSITDTSYYDNETGKVTGKYVPYLVELSGLVVNNQGIAGGTIATGGVHGGSGNILQRIKSTDYSGVDLVTIEGFVNDFATAVSIGEIGDTTNNNSMVGAIYEAVTYIQQHSNARVVLITEHTGRKYTLTTGIADYEILKRNSINLLQKDYNDAIKLVGNLCNVPVIDAGSKSQISQFHPEYLIDHLHHSELGGKQYAYAIWDELKNISPLL